MDSRSYVRSSIRYTISEDPRIRFWWFFAQSYILMSLKNVPSGFLKKILVLPFLAVFCHFVHFWPKNQVFELFFKTAHQEFHITQKLETIAFNHLTVVSCLGKFWFWPFRPIFGQKYIACGDKVSLGCDKIFFGHFLDLIWSKIWPFLLKNQVSAVF